MIQQIALHRTPAERLVKVLAVDVDQQLPKGLELLNRNGVAIDECARAAIGIDDSSQQALVVFVQRLFFEPGAGTRDSGHVEFGAELGTLRTRAHELAAASFAEHQAERVDENGLAGAGFTGQNRHPGFELDLDAVDNGKVFNLQRYQHR